MTLKVVRQFGNIAHQSLASRRLGTIRLWTKGIMPWMYKKSCCRSLLYNGNRFWTFGIWVLNLYLENMLKLELRRNISLRWKRIIYVYACVTGILFGRMQFRWSLQEAVCKPSIIMQFEKLCNSFKQTKWPLSCCETELWQKGGKDYLLDEMEIPHVRSG